MDTYDIMRKLTDITQIWNCGLDDIDKSDKDYIDDIMELLKEEGYISG